MQAGTYFPNVRRMLLCFFSFNFNTLLANFHAASGAHRCCHSVSSWDRSSNVGELGLRWWGSPGQITPRDGFWSRISAWRDTALVNGTHRIGFSMFELFRKIDEDFGGSITWDTQPNCRVFDDLHPTGPLFDSWRVSRITTGCPVLTWLLSRFTTGCPVRSCSSCFFNMATGLLSPSF